MSSSYRGLTTASLLLALWAASHVATVFYFDFHSDELWLVPLIICWLGWLYVGLFIVAHDCMHGSLAESSLWNRRIGRLCLMLYAAFDFDAMQQKHRQHHEYTGTARDPDYYGAESASEMPSFRRWYLKFFREYSSLRQYASIAAISAGYVLLFAVPLENVLVFWALPAILSSVQLFAFGTYLPHRPDREPFRDQHKARSNDYPHWLSLMTCFHFGYHHEHHLKPSLPWWRLPEARAESQTRLSS
ncbi:MAG: crtW [Myxococcaceae bacterium]|nr:crtW [Myxococcaceae bacterium]